MDMSMRFTGRVHGSVGMLMVFIMHVRMCVCHRRVDVLVFMTLGHVQPDTYSHERSCREEPQTHWLF